MEHKQVEKKICKECGIEKSENHYYLTPKGIRLEVCKDCFTEEFCKENDILKTFKKYDIPFYYTIYDKTFNNVGEYMKLINSLPQYKNKTWKDSILYKEEDEVKTEVNFYDDIVKNLKEEAKKLNQKLVKLRDNHDMNGYIATLKSLRETLDLIHKYDWQLYYSEYNIGVDTNDGKSFEQKQVAVWEQNNDNQIRNHIIWNVEQKVNIDELSNNTIKNIKNELNKTGVLR